MQTEQPWKYLGWKLFTSQVFPQPLHIVDKVTTLHDLQILLGTTNWVQLLLGITTEELSPLFTLLKGDSDLLSSRRLTPEAKTVLQKVSDKIATPFASRINVKLPIDLYIIYAFFQPYALLGQWCVNTQELKTLECIFLSHMPMKTFTTKADMIMSLIAQGRNRCQQLTGRDPDTIYLLLATDDFVVLNRESLSLQAALGDYLNETHYTLPQHKLLHSLSQIPLQPKNRCVPAPIKGAQTVFLDGSGKTHKAVVVWKQTDSSDWESSILTVEGPTQVVELSAALHAFELFSAEPLSVVADSACCGYCSTH